VNGHCAGPDCGNCQACDLDTGKCGLPCPDPCTAGRLRSQAEINRDYTTLLQHLRTQGFTPDYSQAATLLQNRAPFRSVLSVHLSSAAGALEAHLNFAVDAVGQTGATALVRNQSGIQYGLFVDTNGIVSLLPGPGSQAASGQVTTPTVNPSATAAVPETEGVHASLSPMECGILCGTACSLGGSLACTTISTLLVCSFTGPGALLCAYVMDATCGVLAGVACGALCSHICTCTPGVDSCGAGCPCPPGATCVEGRCIQPCSNCEELTASGCVPTRRCPNCYHCDPSDGTCKSECGPSQVCCGGVCTSPENCCASASNSRGIMTAATEGSCGEQLWCPCNGTCYQTATECTSNCHVTLGCFTNICRPALPGECGR